jgi:electron transfer flavoprotein alpha subunit
MTRPRIDRSVEAAAPADMSVRRRRDNAARTDLPLVAKRPRLKRDLQAMTMGPSGARPRTSNAAASLSVAGPSLRTGQRQSGPAQASPAMQREQNLPGAAVIRVEAPARYRMVISFARQAWPDCEQELVALARDAEDKDMAVVVCRIGEAGRDAGAAGADRLVQVAGDEPMRQRAEILAACRQVGPDRIMLPHDKKGAALARYLAAALGLRPALGVTQIRGNEILVPTADGRGEYRRPMASIMSIRETACRTIAAGVRREARPIELQEPAGVPEGVTDHGPQHSDVSMLPLEEAQFIISAGDGVTDFETFGRTARGLAATIAGSRVICDAGHLPRDRQIGASGHVARADCYVALGISGAPQHLEGIRNCTHVVAVNTDLHAAMVERADLAIIADAQQVMPALLRARGASHG